GWFYAGNAELLLNDGGAGLLPDGGAERGDEYALAAPGEQGIGRFELALSAPGAVDGLQFDGKPPVTLARGADVQVSWAPEDMRDQVELELYAGSTVLSCAARDDGQLTLPAATLTLLEADPQASIVVRRVLAVSTEMQGIESALVRFATTRTATLAVQ
ncbi:MAG TPA: hypothetical protein VFX59_24815, partial [Polyangiales bacterium]|nr:hypothetical protein [Polyangiales bacterium]